MGGAKLLKWRLAAEGAKLLKSRAVLILTSPPWPRQVRWYSTCTCYMYMCMRMHMYMHMLHVASPRQGRARRVTLRHGDGGVGAD